MLYMRPVTIAGIVAFAVFVVAAAAYVRACEECKVAAIEWENYEGYATEYQGVKSKGAYQQSAGTIQRGMRGAIARMRAARFRRKLYFIMQVIAGLFVFGVFVFMLVRLSQGPDGDSAGGGDDEGFTFNRLEDAFS